MSSLPASIFRKWIHSREEDIGDVEVYRPASYSFPPSRGRDGLELRPDGQFIHYAIGPTDAQQPIGGQWTLQGPGVVAVDLAQQGAPPHTMTIVACDEDSLKIRRVPVR